jgi:hypothetical protein
MSFDYRVLYDLYDGFHKMLNKVEMDLAECHELPAVFDTITVEHNPVESLFSLERNLLSVLIEFPMADSARNRCLRRFEIILKRQRKLRSMERVTEEAVLQAMVEVIDACVNKIETQGGDQDLAAVHQAQTELLEWIKKYE